jgi:hypothetical protein
LDQDGPGSQENQGRHGEDPEGEKQEMLQSLGTGQVLLGLDQKPDRGEFPGERLAPGKAVNQDRENRRPQGNQKPWIDKTYAHGLTPNTKTFTTEPTEIPEAKK